jgi:uncharacterized protein
MDGTTISYLEIGSGAAGRSSAFFAELFGWPFQPMEGQGDGWFDAGGIKIGLHGNDPDHGMVPYFRVANIHEAVALVRELGGQVDEATAEEPGFGIFRNCKDPAGVRFGLHQL